jgi:hypothetical protein
VEGSTLRYMAFYRRARIDHAQLGTQQLHGRSRAGVAGKCKAATQRRRYCRWDINRVHAVRIKLNSIFLIALAIYIYSVAAHRRIAVHTRSYVREQPSTMDGWDIPVRGSLLQLLPCAAASENNNRATCAGNLAHSDGPAEYKL